MLSKIRNYYFRSLRSHINLRVGIGALDTMTPSFSLRLAIFAALLLLLEPVLCRNISEIDLTDTNVSIFESAFLKPGGMEVIKGTDQRAITKVIHANTNIIVADFEPRRSSATKHRVIQLQTCHAYVPMWASTISGPVLSGMPQATRITTVSNTNGGTLFYYLFFTLFSDVLSCPSPGG